MDWNLIALQERDILFEAVDDLAMRVSMIVTGVLTLNLCLLGLIYINFYRVQTLKKDLEPKGIA